MAPVRCGDGARIRSAGGAVWRVKRLGWSVRMWIGSCEAGGARVRSGTCGLGALAWPATDAVGAAAVRHAPGSPKMAGRSPGAWLPGAADGGRCLGVLSKGLDSREEIGSLFLLFLAQHLEELYCCDLEEICNFFGFSILKSKSILCNLRSWIFLEFFTKGVFYRICLLGMLQRSLQESNSNSHTLNWWKLVFWKHLESRGRRHELLLAARSFLEALREFAHLEIGLGDLKPIGGELVDFFSQIAFNSAFFAKKPEAAGSCSGNLGDLGEGFWSCCDGGPELAAIWAKRCCGHGKWWQCAAGRCRSDGRLKSLLGAHGAERIWMALKMGFGMAEARKWPGGPEVALGCANGGYVRWCWDDGQGCVESGWPWRDACKRWAVMCVRPGAVRCAGGWLRCDAEMEQGSGR
ncbi:hypothetical protein Taro_024723 [Colocasia esculenta]|uniref:Uncharacterized protein n=1 Tax=Colocasia esculenta TaxID=4460 RepID=A0A843VFD0_COLES|nr:hypothetical protein [Colocasia esculenta]